jgi:hypothetical protein
MTRSGAFSISTSIHFCRTRNSKRETTRLTPCRRYLPNYEKAPPAAELSPMYDDAVARATRLDARQALRDCDGANPSTGVYRLTEKIKDLGRPRG